MEKKKYFDVIQVYRGIAALLVVVHHTYASFEHFHDFNIPTLGFLAKIGKLGVDFFFVLSGFIITYTTFKYRGDRGYLKKYFSARVLRIYIPYLPIAIPSGNPVLSVAWTLVFEMFFYVVYALNFFSKKLWYFFLTGWIVCILSASVFNLKSTIPMVQNFLNLYNLEFILGVLIAYLIKSKYKPDFKVIFPLALGGILVFLYMRYFNISLFAFSQNLMFSLCMGLFVILAIYFWNKQLNAKNVFMLLGNSSYSLYLLHNPLQSVLVRVVPKLNIQLFILIEFLMVIVTITFVSYLYYLIFEKKIISMVKEKLDIYLA